MSKVLVNESSLTGIADAIRGKNGTNNAYMPSEMAQAITNLPTGADPVLNDLAVNANGIYNPPEGVDGFSMVTVNVPSSGDIEVEPIYLSGALPYACAGPIASQYIELFGDTITTGNLMGCTNMFQKYTNSTVPFELNFRNDTGYSAADMFNESMIVEPPVINRLTPNSLSSFFNRCYYLQRIPEGFSDNWRWDYLHSQIYNGCGSFFAYCKGLRSVPENMLKELYSSATYNTYTYYRFFNECQCLDSINGMFVAPGTLTSNCFTDTFNKCNRINAMTFAKNDDGSCKTANWKNQIIDLTTAGYVQTNLDSLETYGGITADKEVYDLTTYADLSSDPDWYATSAEWSRYNGYCALTTVQSLPDCSSSGGTNTIKFTDAGGSSIVDETMSEIFAQNEATVAEATAKGWTISFV